MNPACFFCTSPECPIGCGEMDYETLRGYGICCEATEKEKREQEEKKVEVRNLLYA